MCRRNFWMSQAKKTRLELIISLICTLASRLIGFVRASVEMALLGLGAASDAWQGGFRLTNFFRELFGEGALGSVFTPIYEQEIQKGNSDTALQFAWSCALFVLLLSSLLALMIAGLIQPILGFWLQGMDENNRQITGELALLMLPYLPFIATGSVFMLLHQIQGRFAISSLHPILFSLAILITGFMNPLESIPHSLALGVSLGGFLQMLVMGISLKIPWMNPFRIVPVLPLIQRMLWLMLPILGALSLSRSRSLVEVSFASGLSLGGLGSLAYAYTLLQVPIGIISIATGNVLMPRLARLHAQKDTQGYAHLLHRGLRLLLGLAIPASIFLAGYAKEFCELVFQTLPALIARPALSTQEELSKLALAVHGYAPALIPLILVPLLTRAFHARLETKTPALLSVLTLIVQTVFCLILVPRFQMLGITWATTLAFLSQSLMLLYLLSRQESGFRPASLLKAGGIFLALAVLAYQISTLLPSDEHQITRLIAYPFIYFPFWLLLEWRQHVKCHQPDHKNP